MVEISIVTFSKLSSRLDADYYRPKFIQIEDEIDKLSNSQNYDIKILKKLTDKIRKGIFYILKEEYQETGVPFIRVGNIKEMIIDEDDITYITEEKNNQENATSLKPKDIVVSKSGSIGRVAFIPYHYEKANISQDVIGISVKEDEIPPEYIVAYLSSKYGQIPFNRNRSQQTHQHLALEPVRTLNVAIPKLDTIIENISSLVERGIKTYYSAIEKHDLAINELYQQLGLEELSLINKTIFQVNVSDLKGILGWTAEQHLPKYASLKRAIDESNYDTEKLGKIVQISKDRVDPTKEPTTSFNYVELADVNQTFGDIESYSTLSGYEAPSRARIKIRKGDVLVPYLAGSSEKVSIVTDRHHDMVATTGFYALRSVKYDNWYLFTLFRSGVIQTQLEQYVTGTIMQSVSQTELKNVILPVPPIEQQLKISNIMQEAFRLKHESEKLIQQSIERVENEIQNELDRMRINGVQ